MDYLTVNTIAFDSQSIFIVRSPNKPKGDVRMCFMDPYVPTCPLRELPVDYGHSIGAFGRLDRMGHVSNSDPICDKK